MNTYQDIINSSIEDIKTINKLKEDNAALLDALSLVLGSFALERVERFDIVEKCKAAIQKAESK